MAKPDPTLLVDVVAPKVLEALKLASEALTKANNLEAHAPAFVAAFDECVAPAEEEEA